MTLTELHNKYDVVGTIDLATWTDDYQASTARLLRECQKLHREVYTENQRIIFLHNKDYYVESDMSAGIGTVTLVKLLLVSAGIVQSTGNS